MSEAGGWQDQIAASFGGFNRINFNADGYEVLPVIISPERKKQLNQNLMMFFTGFTRFSSDVQKANAAGKQDKTAQLKEMLALVDDAERVLTDKSEDLDDFGRMLDRTWKLKRQDLVRQFPRIASMNSMRRAWPLVHWAENYWEPAVADSWYCMYSRTGRITFPLGDA